MNMLKLCVVVLVAENLQNIANGIVDTVQNIFKEKNIVDIPVVVNLYR